MDAAALARTPVTVDPLAVGYLTGRGLSPTEVRSWTAGACSRVTKPSSCYAAIDPKLAPGSVRIDPLAVGYLTGRGLSPSEVEAWTVGICSHPSKPAVCDALFDSTAGAASTPNLISRPNSFDWRDAGIGAGMALGFFSLLAGAGASFVARHHRQQKVAA
jgi:hypothetical protein